MTDFAVAWSGTLERAGLCPSLLGVEYPCITDRFVVAGLTSAPVMDGRHEMARNRCDVCGVLLGRDSVSKGTHRCIRHRERVRQQHAGHLPIFSPRALDHGR